MKVERRRNEPRNSERVGVAPGETPLAYRPDIQILRAVAVAVVLMFHLSVPGFGSGFLGVDVFFVISGYLMQALYGHGITARDFYTRRARRLLPAYFGAVLATLVACFFITLPGEFSSVVDQSLWASILSANVGYWFQVSYFENSDFRPMLHLWSLGVEAQFYLILPLLFRLRARWVALVAIASLAMCLGAVLVSPKLAFFMMPLRIWEFALGMLGARISFDRYRPIGLAALVGIAAVMLIPVDGKARNLIFGHPALAAIMVTALTAVTLMCRLPRPLEESLPGRAAQRVGDASYSLYLAHFPVIVLMNYQPFEGTQLGFRLWTVPLIAIATLTLYFGLERRGPKLFSIRSSILSVAAIWLLVAILPRAQLLRFGPPERKIFAALDDRAVYRCGKLFRILHPRDKFCPIGRGQPVLLVGDSHADAIKQTFATVAENHGWGVYLSVDNDPLRSSSLTASQLRQEADKLGARWVFLHFAWPDLTPQMIEDSRRELGSRLVVIEPTPDWRDSVPKLLYQHKPAIPLPRDPAIDQYLHSHPEIPVIRVDQRLCSPGCRVEDSEGHPLYFDAGHLSLTGAAQLRPLFEAWFNAHPPPTRPAGG
jgi:peptidoglycan/LPS O-acetylase OafA/YrhL